MDAHADRLPRLTLKAGRRAGYKAGSANVRNWRLIGKNMLRPRLTGFDLGCVKTVTRKKCRKYSSTPRASSSRAQHDSAVMTEIYPVIFYAYGGCRSFYTAKTHKRHRQDDLRVVNCHVASIGAPWSVDPHPERFDHRRPENNIGFEATPEFLGRRIETGFETRIDQFLPVGRFRK